MGASRLRKRTTSTSKNDRLIDDALTRYCGPQQKEPMKTLLPREMELIACFAVTTLSEYFVTRPSLKKWNNRYFPRPETSAAISFKPS
jgi:hypothetical protein